MKKIIITFLTVLSMGCYTPPETDVVPVRTEVRIVYVYPSRYEYDECWNSFRRPYYCGNYGRIYNIYPQMNNRIQINAPRPVDKNRHDRPEGRVGPDRPHNPPTGTQQRPSQPPKPESGERKRP